jgi:glycosyltransferase involved in cell wall biosynthesis
LRALPNVAVENRWVPEAEIASLLAWSDALVLPYREASQSGVAAAAISSRRWVVATRVGGLEEQFRDEALAVMCDPDPISIADAIDRLSADTSRSAQIAPFGPDNWLRSAADLLAQLERRFGPFAPVGLAFP